MLLRTVDRHELTAPTVALVVDQATRNNDVSIRDLFERFLPGSLNHLVWTNLIAHTNGRTTSVWEERTHPANWPTNPPQVKWNSNSLLHDWHGWTAISPCWEGEVWSGQLPITALTRRHGYTRGHGMGEDGLSTNYSGRKVWFVNALTASSRVGELGDKVARPRLKK